MSKKPPLDPQFNARIHPDIAKAFRDVVPDGLRSKIVERLVKLYVDNPRILENTEDQPNPHALSMAVLQQKLEDAIAIGMRQHERNIELSSKTEVWLNEWRNQVEIRDLKLKHSHLILSTLVNLMTRYGIEVPENIITDINNLAVEHAPTGKDDVT